MSFFEKLFGKKGDSKDSHGSSKSKGTESHTRFDFQSQYQQPFIEAFKLPDANGEVEYSAYQAYFCDRLAKFSAKCANDANVLRVFCTALTNVGLSDASKSPSHSGGGKHAQHSSHQHSDGSHCSASESVVKSVKLAQFAQVAEFVRSASQTPTLFHPVVRVFLAELRSSASSESQGEADPQLYSLLSLCITQPVVEESHVRQLAATLTRTLADAKVTGGEEKLLDWLVASNIDASFFGDLLNRIYFGVFTSTWKALLETDDVQGDSASSSRSAFDRLFLPSALQSSSVLASHNRWLLATLISDVYKLQGGNRDESGVTLTSAVPQGANSLLVNRIAHAHKLYDSEEHGLSQNRFETKLNAYKAPMIIVVSFGAGNTAVVFLDQTFHNSLTRYGDFATGVVTLQPKFERLMFGANTFYFNTLARSGRRGLNIGLSDSRLAFEIDFDKLVVNDFTKSSATGSTAQQLGTIEVYGCGSEEAIRKQKEQMDVERKDIERARNRKLKPDDWESNTDREILELGGIKTRHSERGDL